MQRKIRMGMVGGGAGAFIGAMVSTELTRTIAALFVVAMLALIASLLLFLREIFLAVSTPRHVPK